MVGVACSVMLCSKCRQHATHFRMAHACELGAWCLSTDKLAMPGPGGAEQIGQFDFAQQRAFAELEEVIAAEQAEFKAARAQRGQADFERYAHCQPAAGKAIEVSLMRHSALSLQLLAKSTALPWATSWRSMPCLQPWQHKLDAIMHLQSAGSDHE